MDDNSKIRKIIKTTLNEWLNENISIKINNLVDDYRENIGCTINQINRGYCDEFAEDLLNDVGGESNDVFLLSPIQIIVKIMR